MTQQLQQPQTVVSRQSRQGQQPQQIPGQQGQQPQTITGQQVGQRPQQVGGVGQQRFEDAVPTEIQFAIDELDQIATVAEWAHVQAMNAGQPQVASISNDIQDLANVQKRLLVRQSQFVPVVDQCLSQALQQGIQQLGQFTDQPGVQAEIQQIQRAIPTIQQAVQRIQQFGQQGQQIGQQGQQIGQQPIQTGQPQGLIQ